jgi:mannosyltransferase OCH1-like enzyme
VYDMIYRSMTSFRSFKIDFFNTLKCSLLLYFLHISYGGKFEGKYYNGFDLPLLPASFPNLLESNTTYMPSKYIPSNIWIAVRNVSDVRPNHLKGFVQRNSNWTLHYAGNAEKDEFMTKFFFNTSTLWAYNLLNPLLGTAKSEIWRLCVLYTYGGLYIYKYIYIHVYINIHTFLYVYAYTYLCIYVFRYMALNICTYIGMYMDDDATLETKLDDIVGHSDKLIMGQEPYDFDDR